VAPTAAVATPASLDATFGGGDGLVTELQSGAPSETLQDLVVQPDGKYVAVGTSGDFTVYRFNPDGTRDATFGGGDGFVSTDITGNDVANAVALQPDGKIVVAGRSNGGGNNDFSLARYNADGTPDPAFSGDGKLTTPIGTAGDIALAVAIQPDGKIVAGGSSIQPATLSDFALVRYNSDGIPDSSFDGDGKVTTDFGGLNDEVRGLAIEANGQILGVGTAAVSGNTTVATARYSATNGAPDTSWDTDGKRTDLFATGENSFGQKVVLDHGQPLVAASAGVASGDREFGLLRYNEFTGALDTSFSSDGKASTTNLPNTTSPTVTDLALQPDGKIVVAGSLLTAGIADMGVARFTNAGAVDTTFSSGVVPYGFSTASTPNDNANAVALDGKRIVLAGSIVVGTATHASVARLQGGDPDTAAPNNPTLRSTDHTPGTCSDDRTVSIEAVQQGVDVGDSGVAGYSVEFSTDAETVPDTTVDVAHPFPGLTSPELPDGIHFLHMRTIDHDGNASPAAHIGPFPIACAPVAPVEQGQSQTPRADGGSAPQSPPSADKLFIAAFPPKLVGVAGKRVTLNYVSTAPATVRLDVLKGSKRVARVTGTAEPGRNSIRWNGKIGKKAAGPGTYPLRLTAVAGDQTAVDTATVRLTKPKRR